MPKRRLPLPWLTAAIGLVGIAQVLKLRAGLSAALDFLDYWLDARVGVLYGWSRIYDGATVRVVLAAEGVSRPFATDQVPWLVLLCAPFALLPYPLAEFAWTLLLVAAMVVAWLLAAPGEGLQKVAFGVAALAATPVALALAFGQASILVAACLAAGYHLLKRERPVAAGLVMGGLLLKPHIALAIPVVLLAVRPRAFLALAAFGTLTGLGILLVIGPQGVSSYIDYLRTGAVVVGGQPLGHPVDLTLGGVSGPLPTIARTSILALAALVVARTRRGPVAIPLITAILASLLATPFEHTYDSVLLVVAAWMHLGQRSGAGDRAVVLTALAVSFLEPYASGLMSLVMCGWLGLLAVQATTKGSLPTKLGEGVVGIARPPEEPI